MAACFSLPDVWKCWDKSGKHEFLKVCHNLISFSNDGILTDSKELRGAVYDLLWNAIRGQIKLDHAASVAKMLSDMHMGIVSLLADTFSIIDVEIVCLDEKFNRDNFLSLLSLCLTFIPENILKERLDNDTLEAVNAINNKLVYSQKYVKLKTKLFYKQQKFNLLREESEGYSKLATELLQAVARNTNNQTILQNIMSLVGGFNLDPNRVLDIILETFENTPSMVDLFVPLLQGYMTDPITICDILGFKFKFYKDEETPSSLYDLAALLLQHSLIKLSDIYPHLTPDDGEIVKVYKKEITDARQYARKMSMMILSDKSSETNVEQEKDEKEIIDENNQKIGVCHALLKFGDWKHARELMDRLPPFVAVAESSVSKALCSLISGTIQHIYSKYAQPSGAKGHKEDASPAFKSQHPINEIEELDEDFFKMVSYLGPYLSRDPVLMWKLIRIGRVVMKKKTAGNSRWTKAKVDELYVGIISMTDEVLLPSLSLMPHNPCITEELWTLITLFQYEIRYRLYGRWKNYSYAIHPSLIRTKANVIERGKYIMKRLSKENVKPSGRQLGKLSHANPGVIFEYVLSQIQKYDNFIGPVVDSFKYLSSLSYDMLTYVMIEALANPEKERMKHDGANLSLWIQSLASFSGAICRKYNIELAGLMQYVINQLKAGKSYDLLILREVLQKMTGIEVTDEITYDQLDALAGGELLRAEGGYFAQVRNTKKSSQRLKDTLLEHDLVAPLCILIAQQRLCVIFKEGKERHLKLVGKLYDQCQDTLVQLGSFLANQLSSEDYMKHLPSLKAMVDEYHLTPDSAFFLYRPMCAHAIISKFDELRKHDRSLKQSSSTSLKTQRFIEASEKVMGPLVESVKSLHHIKVWDDISPQFYVSFWTLSMYDLEVPHASYEKEISKVKNNMTSLDDNKDMVSLKKKKEHERYQVLMDKLKDEEKKQQDHCNRVMARLKQQCQGWFPKRSTKNETITQFLQLCIFPRCCFTASDAMYCAKFVLIIHNLKTENFSTLLCYDRVFSEITYTLTSCTESEASRYGRFLCCMLSQVIKWHSDKNVYEKECGDYPGFVTVLRASGAESNNKADQLDFENFRHVCHKWQYKLTKAVVACLESKDYTQIRNTLILLTKILPYFPLVENLGNVLEKRVDKIRVEEKEKRPDIYALAMGYSGQLKSRKPSMIPEAKFHTKEPKVAPPTVVVKKEPSSLEAGSSSPNQTHGKSDVDIKMNGEKVDRKERTSNPISNKNDLIFSRKVESSSKMSSKDKVSKEDKEEKGNRKIKEEKSHRSNKSHREEKEKSHTEKRKEENGRDEKSKIKKDKEDKSIRDEVKRKEENGRDEKSKIKKDKEDKSIRDEVKREGRSKVDEKEQRASSVTSNSSQGSATPATKQDLSPARDETEREPKRRKMEQNVSSSSSSAVSKNRERKEKDRSHEGKRNEKKREMVDLERDDYEVKRHKDDDSGNKSSKSPRNSEDLGKERKGKGSKSSQDGERKRSKEKKNEEKDLRKECKDDGRKEHRDDGKENKRDKKSKKDKDETPDGIQKHRSKLSP